MKQPEFFLNQISVWINLKNFQNLKTYVASIEKF